MKGNTETEIDLFELKKRLQSEGMQPIAEVYKRYRNEFLQFGKKYTTDTNLILETFHDAVIDLYEILLANKYDAAKSSLKTYLFTLGKYKLFNKLKKERHAVSELALEGWLKDEAVTLSDIDNQNFNTTQVKTMEVALAKLGEKCRELLVLTYYHNYCIEAILHNMGYKNEQVVYSHKSRCLKQLKEIFKTS